jgi:hypothetical protein
VSATLYQRVAEHQLDLLKLATSGSAELRAGPASVMRRDAGDASIGRILLEHLPDNLFGHGFALYLVASIHRAEYAANQPNQLRRSRRRLRLSPKLASARFGRGCAWQQGQRYTSDHRVVGRV